jgi:hypothetical protein
MVEASSEWQIRMNCQTSPHYVGAIYRDLTGLYMDALPIGHPPYFCIGARPLPSQRLFFRRRYVNEIVANRTMTVRNMNTASVWDCVQRVFRCPHLSSSAL